MEFVILLLAIFAAAGLQKRLYQKRAFRNLEYSCTLSKTEVFEGEELELVEVVRNRKWLPLPWLKAEISTSKYLEIAEKTATINERVRTVSSFFVMRSFRQTTRHWKIKTSKRGHFKVHNVTLVSSDLLGSSAISQVIPVELELTVLPRPLDLEDMQLFPRHVSGDMVVKRNLLTDPFFIAGIRPYTGHEPLSRIHWNATAKEQELMVFQNESTARQNLTVLLNMQSREHEHHEIIDREVVENGIRCCAAVLDRACETQMPVRVLSNGTICEDKSHTAGKFAVKEEDRPKDIDTGEDWGEEHTLTVLRTLADLQGYTVEEFPKWLNQQQEQQKIESSDVVLITGYLNDEICAFAREKQLNGVNVQIFLLNRGTYLPDDLQICQV